MCLRLTNQAMDDYEKYEINAVVFGNCFRAPMHYQSDKICCPVNSLSTTIWVMESRMLNLVFHLKLANPFLVVSEFAPTIGQFPTLFLCLPTTLYLTLTLIDGEPTTAF